MDHHHALTHLATILAAAFLGGAVFRKLKQPVLVGYIIVGLILSPSVLGVVQGQEEVSLLAELGILLLLFIVGMEIDMANDVAAKMGVDIELVAVQSSNRMQFLEQGKIDLMIATMSARKDRRELVGIVGPNYYTSGTNVMSPKALGLTEWEDLRDKPVCGKQGAFYNQIVEQRYGAKIIAFTGNAEAKQALRDKKCIAWVYDDSSIGSDLSSGNWDDFEMPLASEDDNPWALAVPSAERNCVFGRFMSGMQYQWHQDGTLIELEAKWGIKATAYLAGYNERMGDWLAD